MRFMTAPPRAVAGRSLRVGASVCAALLALGLAGGCSAGQPPQGTAKPPDVRDQPPVTGTVLSWGSFFGGLPGNFGTQRSPVKVALPGKVAEVGTSNAAQYALLANGSLYAWGLGTQGELGNGGTSSSFRKPVRVRFPAGVKIAYIPTDAMPYDTGLAVDTRGHVWGWGNNGGGDLCLGTATRYLVPVQLPFSSVTALAGAANHALYDAGGTIWACGQNVAGDLGDGSQHGSTTPVKVDGLAGQRVTTLVASFANSGALLASGQYYDWGYDAQGQLGDGHPGHASDVPVLVHLRAPVTQVAQGGSLWNNGQSLVMLADGSLWAWGSNRAGQLGDRTRRMQPAPVAIHPPPGVTYRSLATGSATSYAVSTTGGVFAWGTSHLGQTGDGRTRTAITPVPVATGATSISSTANNAVINVPGR